MPRPGVHRYLVDRITIDPSGCWLWTGPLVETGYGIAYQYKHGRHSTIRAHRLVYETFIGEIPAGLELDHLCKVRHCVHPLHLEPVTHRENQLRSDSVSARASRKQNCSRGHALVPVPRPPTRSGRRRYCPTCRPRDAHR